MSLTCDIEVSIARSFAQLVGDDTLVDAGMLRSHSREHQAMDIPVWGVGDTMILGLSQEDTGWAHVPRGLALYSLLAVGGRRGGKSGADGKKCVHLTAKPKSRLPRLYLQARPFLPVPPMTSHAPPTLILPPSSCPVDSPSSLHLWRSHLGIKVLTGFCP